MKTLATRVTFATIVAVFVMVGVGVWLFSRSSSTFVPQNGGPTQLTAVTLRLPIPVVDTGLSPFYLAIDKGMFAKYGLDVTLEPGSAQLNPIQTVLQGTDTFGLIGGPELLLSARARGASVVAVSLLHKDSDFVVFPKYFSRGSLRSFRSSSTQLQDYAVPILMYLISLLYWAPLVGRFSGNFAGQQPCRTSSLA